MKSFENKQGYTIILRLIKAIQDNKQYLSDIDGAIGDGDHGINMNKGFTACGEALKGDPGDFAHCLHVLSEILMNDIGGSMGPLYGMFFEGMETAVSGMEKIDAKAFGKMLTAAKDGVLDIGGANLGDKTLLDCLIPAVKAYNDSIDKGSSFEGALEEMKKAAVIGRDSTKDMIARVGRSSRLGERSRGVIDAGSASCCVILCAIADAVEEIIA